MVCLLIVGLCTSAFAQQTGNDTTSRDGYPLIFKASFNNRRDLGQWTERPPTKDYSLVWTGIGNRALRIKARSEGDYLFSKVLPVELVRGRKLLMRMRVRNAGISTRRSFYHGVKIVLHFSSPAGEAHPQLNMPSDPFGWQEIGFTTAIPPEVTQCKFTIGLEQVSGKVFFDDVEIRLAPIDSSPTGQRNNVVEAAASKPPMLRGAMIAPRATAEDLRTLAGWGANNVRWQLTWNSFPQSPADTASLSSYMAWLRGLMDHVESLLPLCDSLGLQVVLDLHTLPGGYPYPGQANRLFGDKSLQSAFRDMWKEIATRFKDAPAVWGYDLGNEPAEGYMPDGVMDWQSLTAATAADIRAIDTTHYIIVEGAPHGSWLSLLSLRPLKGISKCIYSFHTYDPMSFTHQGIDRDTGVVYPGMIDGQYWDAATMKRYLQPIRDWQLRHNVSIYVGEFSAVRWAPEGSAVRYLRDCINLFEEWGFSWSYHAFREWDGWSVENNRDPDDHVRTTVPTDRQLLLMEAYGKNGLRK